MNVHHPVQERGGHWLHNRAILCTVSRPNHNRAGRKQILAQSALVNQAIERFLYLVRTRVELIEKKTIGLSACETSRRTKHACSIHDQRYPDQILGRQLTSKERDTRQTDLAREILHECGFADTGWPPDKDG